MNEPQALICAFALDGHGGGRPLDWPAIRALGADEGTPWIHLHREAEQSARWLREESGIPQVVCDALLSEESRPRCTPFDDQGLLLDLRGVNFNPGADPEDMVSIRAWFDGKRIVTARRRHLMAIDDIRTALGRGEGPTTVAEFMLDLAERLVARMAPIVSQLDERVDTLEEALLAAQGHELRRGLGEVRRQAIALRRYIGPNREALSRLMTDVVPWLGQQDRQRVREISDRITRYLEDLDAARERAAVIQDELSSLLTERMNRNTYVLSVVAGIFLPLSLVTGLLGINVAGIPGEKWSWAFAAVCALLVALGIAEFWVLRRRKWL